MTPLSNPITLQQLVNRLATVESANVVLQNVVAQLTPLYVKITEWLALLESENHTLRDTIQSLVAENTGLKANMESATMLHRELDTIKEKQLEIVDRHSALLTETGLKVKSWASLCSSVAEVPLSSVEKLVQGKIDDEWVRRTRELNLRVCGLSSIEDPSTAGYSFLKDQLDISDITLDRCWLGLDGTLFIQFLSLSDRLWALRE